MEDSQLIEKYSGKILGIRNYASQKKEFFISDFTNEPVLLDFMSEVFTGESDISPAGKSFLEKYYGWVKMANMLLSPAAFYPFSSLEDARSSLMGLNPMEVTLFVAQARGEIEKGEVVNLRPDLLPPEGL